MCVVSFSSDEQVLILYKDLYFRHIYAKMTPTVDDKFDSFQNYVDLFNMLLGLDSNDAEFEIPASWLWDIIDEVTHCACMQQHEREADQDCRRCCSCNS